MSFKNWIKASFIYCSILTVFTFWKSAYWIIIVFVCYRNFQGIYLVSQRNNILKSVHENPLLFLVLSLYFSPSVLSPFYNNLNMLSCSDSWSLLFRYFVIVFLYCWLIATDKISFFLHGYYRKHRRRARSLLYLAYIKHTELWGNETNKTSLSWSVYWFLQCNISVWLI